MQVHGLTIVPSTCLLELAGAMGRMVVDDSVPHQVSVTGASFTAAVNSTHVRLLRSELHRHSGCVTVSSHAADVALGAEVAVHLSGQICALREGNAAAGCQPGAPAVRHRGILAALATSSARLNRAKTDSMASCIADVAHRPLAPDSTRFWMHPAAAEAAMALQAFLHRALPAGCRRCMRAAACGAYQTGSRRATSRKLRAAVAGQHRRRRGRSGRRVTSMSLQETDGGCAASMMDVTAVLTGPDPATNHASYTTIWQQMPEPIEVHSGRCDAFAFSSLRVMCAALSSKRSSV